jgi:hypothetical protein
MTVACYIAPARKKADQWMRDVAEGCGGKLIMGAWSASARDIGNEL